MSTTTSTILSASPKSTLSTHPDVNFLNVLPISEAGDGDIELAHVSAKPDISRSTSPSLINTDPQLRGPSSALGLRGRSIGLSPTEAPDNATNKQPMPSDDDGEEDYPEGGDGWLVLFGIFVIFFLYFGELPSARQICCRANGAHHVFLPARRLDVFVGSDTGSTRTAWLSTIIHIGLHRINHQPFTANDSPSHRPCREEIGECCHG